MIRVGGALVALALACEWLAETASAPFRIAELVALVAGAALLLAGREPWPHCCEHCHVHEPDEQLDDEPHTGRHAAAGEPDPETDDDAERA